MNNADIEIEIIEQIYKIQSKKIERETRTMLKEVVKDIPKIEAYEFVFKLSEYTDMVSNKYLKELSKMIDKIK